MRKKAAAALTAIMCALLSGCTGSPFEDFREIDQLEPIQTVGIDSGGGLITATAASSDRENTVVMKNSSVTLSRALSEMQNYTNKKYIFYDHNENLLIGEDAAREGIAPFLEYVERDAHMRLSTKLYIVKDGTAEDIISEAGSENGGIGSLLQSLEKDVRLMSESYVFGCGEAAEMMEEDGCALAAAIMHISGENTIRGGSESTVMSAGYAVFKDGKLIRFIDRYHAHAVNLLINKMGGDIVEIDDGEGGFASIRLTRSRAKYSAEFDADGSLKKLFVNIDMTGNIEELQERLNIADPAVIDRLERSLEAMEKFRVEYILSLSRQLRADFCKIGRKINMKYPIRFSRIADDWNDQLAEAEVEVEIKAKIMRTYDVGLSPAGAWRKGDNGGQGQGQP